MRGLPGYKCTLPASSHLLCEQEVDAQQELIRLCNTEPTEVKDLPMRIPKESPRYHFFLYKHSHEGDYLQSTGEKILGVGVSSHRVVL